jgi:hypothetical protein
MYRDNLTKSIAEAAKKVMDEQLKGDQHKIDANKNNKIDAHDFKLLRSKKKVEESEQIDEISKATAKSYTIKKMGAFYADKNRSADTMKKDFKGLGAAHARLTGAKPTSEEVDLEEGKMGQLSADLTDLSHADFHKEYGKPKSHFDPTNFKKPVQKGKEMDRAKALAQRGMASMKKEEVDLDEDSKKQMRWGYHIVDQETGNRVPNTPQFKKRQDAHQHLKTQLKDKRHQYEVDEFQMREEVEELEEMFPGTPEYEKKYGKAPQDMKKGEKKKTSQGEMEKTGKGVVHRRKFSEMLEVYGDDGIKGLFEALQDKEELIEEPTNAEFDAQLADAKQRAAGTKKQPEVSKAAVQAVQNEEIELTLEDFTPEELEEFMQTEEYEQLDELSKDTLRSYLKGSKSEAESQLRGDVSDKAASLGRTQLDKDDGRYEGAKKAKRKLAMKEQTHTTVSFVDYNDVNGVKYAEIDLTERELTDAEMKEREKNVKGMKKGVEGFKERYGKDAKSVMYATATKMAKEK